MDQYSTVSGDTWDYIALKTTGSEMNMVAIMEANPQQTGTVIFPAGIVLSIPEIQTAPAVQSAPWR